MGQKSHPHASMSVATNDHSRRSAPMRHNAGNLLSYRKSNSK